MTYSSVAHATVAGASGGTTAGVDTTGADLLVAVFSWYNGGTRPTVSDSKSNTWTQIGTDQAGAITDVAMYYVASPTVGSGHTFTLSGASSFSSLEIQAWSGSAASPLDQTSQAAAYQAGSVTPTQDNELLVAGIGPQDSQNTSAIDLGFTISDNNAYSAGNNEAGAMAYLVETTAAAKNPTWTTPGAANATATIIATFKAAAAGGAAPIWGWDPVAASAFRRADARGRAVAAGGPSFVPAAPTDLLPPRLGPELAPQPQLYALPRDTAARGTILQASGPSFVAANPQDIAPARLGFDLAPQPLLPAIIDRVLKAIPEISGPTFVIGAPKDLLPTGLGYDLAPQPLLPPGADRVLKAIPEISGPVFVTAAPKDLLPTGLGYELASPPLNRARRRAPIPDVFNLPNVFVAASPSFTWSAEPLLPILRPAGRTDLGRVDFVTAGASDLAAPVFGWDQTPPALMPPRRAIWPAVLLAASGPSFVTADPRDIPAPVFGYELTPSFIRRMTPNRDLGRTDWAPFAPVFIAVAAAYGYELGIVPLFRRPSSGHDLGRVEFVTAVPGDLRAPVFGWDPAPPVLTPASSRRGWSRGGIVTASGASFVAAAPRDILIPAFGYELASPPVMRIPRRWVPDTLNLADIFVPPPTPSAFGYELAPPPLLILPRPTRPGAVSAMSAFVVSPPGDLLPPAFGYPLTSELLPLLRVMRRDPSALLQNPVFLAFFTQVGFLLLVSESLSAAGLSLEALLAPGNNSESLE